MDSAEVRSLVQALMADYERQGGQLSEDDVLRLAMKRGAEPDEIEQVLRLLRVEDIEVETDSDLGYLSKYPIRNPAAVGSGEGQRTGVRWLPYARIPSRIGLANKGCRCRRAQNRSFADGY
jgi:hypothetical protein